MLGAFLLLTTLIALITLLTAMENETTQIVVRQIPVDLWRRFKVQAAAEGITVQLAMTKAIQQYVTAA